jgi:protein-L-isoaspartate(D-aspartate) O-methyltransferase
MSKTLYLMSVICVLFLNCSGTTRKKYMTEDQPRQGSWWISKAEKMVDTQIISRGVRDADVIRVMKRTPRHLFVPEHLVDQAYRDHPLPIGSGQTISQPYIVALMTEYLELSGTEKVLEIGTGSGYQAAILAQLADTCYTIEVVQQLAEESGQLLREQGYDNVIVKWGDGYKGWPEHAPFDRIIITAAPETVPEDLVEQLAINGRMVLPVGGRSQELILITKNQRGIKRRDIIPVRFVPMIHPENPIPDTDPGR